MQSEHLCLCAAGPIVSGQGSPQGLGDRQQIASKPLCQALEKAGLDPSVKAVVLRVDSPGKPSSWNMQQVGVGWLMMHC